MFVTGLTSNEDVGVLVVGSGVLVVDNNVVCVVGRLVINGDVAEDVVLAEKVSEVVLLADKA